MSAGVVRPAKGDMVLFHQSPTSIWLGPSSGRSYVVLIPGERAGDDPPGGGAPGHIHAEAVRGGGLAYWERRHPPTV